MSGFLGAIEGVAGGIEGALGGGGFGSGDFLSELMEAFAGSAAQNNGGGSGTAGEMGKVASDMLPLVSAFL
jgi:hypothetical protein